MRTVSVISEKEEEEEDALEAVASSATLTCEWIPPPHGRGGMQNAILVCFSVLPSPHAVGGSMGSERSTLPRNWSRGDFYSADGVDLAPEMERN